MQCSNVKGSLQAKRITRASTLKGRLLQADGSQFGDDLTQY